MHFLFTFFQYEKRKFRQTNLIILVFGAKLKFLETEQNQIGIETCSQCREVQKFAKRSVCFTTLKADPDPTQYLMIFYKESLNSFFLSNSFSSIKK